MQYCSHLPKVACSYLKLEYMIHFFGLVMSYIVHTVLILIQIRFQTTMLTIELCSFSVPENEQQRLRCCCYNVSYIRAVHDPTVIFQTSENQESPRSNVMYCRGSENNAF